MPVTPAHRDPRVRSCRAGAAVLLVALLPAACGAGQLTDSNDTNRIAAPITTGQSLIGNYLASRHAEAERRMDDAAEFLRMALSENPNEPNLLRPAYLATLLDGQTEEALVLARRLAEVDETSDLAAVAVAVGAIKAGRLDEADQQLKGLPDGTLKRMLAPLMGAWIRFGEGDVDAALASLDPLIRDTRASIFGNIHAALIADAAGRADVAEQFFKAAAERQTGLSLPLAQDFGAFLERAGRPDEARALYQRYLDEHPGTRLLDPALVRLDSGAEPPIAVRTVADGGAVALFHMAGIVTRRDSGERALGLGRLGLYLRPDFPFLQLLVADILESMDRLDSANVVYAEIAEDNPLAWQARLNIAINLNRLDQVDSAARTLRQMARDNPDEADPLVQLGDIMRRRERFEEAISAYDAAFTRIDAFEPRHWTLFYNRGIALERARQWPRAEADFLKALEFEPDQPYVLNYLGYSWVEQRHNLDQALEMISKAVSLRPNDGAIVDSLGWAYFRLGRYDEAVRELERAVELRPNDSVINDHLGDAYWSVGRYREARFQWMRALSLDPEPDLRPTIEAKLRDGLVEGTNSGGDR